MFSRILRFLVEAGWFGPLYAIIQWRVRRSYPLNPQENWDFWTQPQTTAVKALISSYPPRPIRSIILRSALKREHEEGIAYHYDLPKEFFELFLDKGYRFYTCADFLTSHDSLEKAQSNKVRSLLDLIDPMPGERILDLGCGWGGMMKAIQEVTGDRENLFGFSLSREQVRHVRDRLGLNASLTNFITEDYEPNSWDKIYSIGAWEHVRPKEIIPVLKKIYRALRPNGRLVQHFFCLNEKGLPTYMIAGQVFFPGSLLVSWDEQVHAIHQTGFTIKGHSIHDYRPTLKAWYWNLSDQADQALRIVDLQTYNRFLTFFSVSWRFFDEGTAQVHRLSLSKSPEPSLC